jgi:protein O-GlcNAc transferase
MSAPPDAVRAALRGGAWEDARAACLAALTEGHVGADVQYAFGLSLVGLGDFAAAIAPLESAHAADPLNTAVARALGVVYTKVERWADAVRILVPIASTLDPPALTACVMAANESGTLEETLPAVEAQVSLAGAADSDLLCEYGRALSSLGRLADAEPVLLKALTAPGASARVHDVLAFLYTDSGRGDLALEHAQCYAERRPASAYAQLHLAIALSLRGRLEESRAARQLALRLGFLRPCDWTSAIELALCDRHEDGRSVARLAAQSLEHVVPREPKPVRRARCDGRLRIGYTSAEFDVAPGAFFMNPFLLAHHRSRFEVFLYDSQLAQRPGPPGRERLGEHLRPVGRLSDDAIVDLIRADGIDILVELSSHFPHSRLPVYARRAAPVQATLPQCPSTTGCREVDYIFTDRWTSPPETHGEYVEQVHLLEGGCVVYTPPADCPPFRAVPAARNGYVTFGLLQRFVKIGDDVWDGIAAVLRATAGSRLLLHNGDGELSRPDSATLRGVRGHLDKRGVDPARLLTIGALPHVAHLDVVSHIDVALDTWPYSGTTTTCECLWMGVPVVTLAGRTHASRVSAGLLRRLGLDELVARDVMGYVAAATQTAASVDVLRTHRATLRARAIAAGLVDGRAAATAIEAAYELWMRPATSA